MTDKEQAATTDKEQEAYNKGYDKSRVDQLSQDTYMLNLQCSGDDPNIFSLEDLNKLGDKHVPDFYSSDEGGCGWSNGMAASFAEEKVEKALLERGYNEFHAAVAAKYQAARWWYEKLYGKEEDSDG